MGERGLETPKAKFFLTGAPGSGKSTVFLRCVESLKRSSFRVGGIATPEIRSGGRRVGFSVVDLATGGREILAGITVSSPFRVGKYFVNVVGFEAVALPALSYAVKVCDVVCIDEIGRMELFSEPFRRKVDELIRGTRPMIAVLHRNYAKTYARFGNLLYVSFDNRDSLAGLVVSRLKKQLGHEGALA